ncbi:uncharacterized protein MYCFIDRAFT_152707 [Pseudocercospora fijiensis CIRAD86]|uniref:Membrane-associated proteins in eicosanoid and glutathione metabolism n=1 Tax=Pseudocercospora fijiensis (strain CIRAD86) TaxID=383855 RepID=M3AIQ9_PSEFD|nr:uncharacterized protein MYCFIDRAFT_152707 [Pseudocercospora fijiensis CIRAD86]EME84481.1 hypothetical protein MYCFIDRAFT_152707 [Pseudocercospora fijiensis CIRAD86]
MSVTIELPKEYGYVVATTAATFFLGFWHGLRGGLARKPTGLKTPKAFADSGDIAAAKDKEQAKAMHVFNCKQRAHAHYNEVQPSTALAMLIAGLAYPRTTTGLGIGFIIGRIVYAIGYSNVDKPNGSGRVLGFVISQPIALALWGLAGWTGVKLVL